MENKLIIGILSANGLITEALLAMMENHPSLSGEIRLLGRAEPDESSVEFGHQTLWIEDLEGCSFDDFDILIATGEVMSQEAAWVREAREAGCIILDVGGHLSDRAESPLIVADVNGGLLNDVVPGSVVALPDAATVQCATLLHPLMRKLTLEQVNLFSCHAVSELERAGVEEMARQTAQMLNGKPARPVLFSRQVAFNLLPMVPGDGLGEPLDRAAMITERLEQVLQAPELPLSVSCCWAPVFYGHTQALQIRVREQVDAPALKRILAEVPGVDLKWDAGEAPSAVSDASGNDYLTLGGLTVRVKNSTDFSLWAVADNLRFGIAGNAVKIIELLVKRLFISYS